jgi:hypothetical protein
LIRQSTCFTLFQDGISAVRLRPYGLGIDPPEDICARYLWNVALCESLYSSLNFLEVALRNAIHTAATSYFHRTDWFDTVMNQRGHPLWGKIQRRQLFVAKQSVAAITTRQTNDDDVIAALPFGFWTGVFNQLYERPLSVHIIKQVFPQMPRHERTPAQVQTRLDNIRKLRNRVFHHEPIWQRPLPAEQHEILTVLSYISPVLYHHAGMTSRFSAVWSAGMGFYRTRYVSWIAKLRP